MHRAGSKKASGICCIGNAEFMSLPKVARLEEARWSGGIFRGPKGPSVHELGVERASNGAVRPLCDEDMGKQARLFKIQ